MSRLRNSWFVKKISILKTVRRFMLASIISTLFVAISANASALESQVVAYSSGSWRGVESQIKFSIPGILPNSGQFVAAPLAISTLNEINIPFAFIEAGPIKNRQNSSVGSDCKPHPYFSTQDQQDNFSDFAVDTTYELQEGVFYTYRVDTTQTTNRFQALFCDGLGCRQIGIRSFVNYSTPGGSVVRTQFRYLFTAVESTGGVKVFPPVFFSNVKGKTASNQWQSQCYDTTTSSIGNAEAAPCRDFTWALWMKQRIYIPLNVR